jgi:uncharacterized protein
MKPSVKLILFILCLPVVVIAQQSSDVVDLKKHKVVIQFNDADSISQSRVVLQVQNVKTAWPNAEVEVVCLAGGLDLLTTANSKASKGVAEWSAKGVVFAACNNTMKMRKVKKEDLLSQAVVVPAAIVELSLKQEEGWSFFRGGK